MNIYLNDVSIINLSCKPMKVELYFNAEVDCRLDKSFDSAPGNLACFDCNRSEWEIYYKSFVSVENGVNVFTKKWSFSARKYL